MKYDPQKHQRRSIRLKGYDYSQPGWYYITLCTHNREHLFGSIKDAKIVLNGVGQIIQNEWLKTGTIRENISIGEFVIMPNHLHGIIQIMAEGAYRNTPQPNTPQPNTPQRDTSQQFKSPSQTIGAIIRGFKSTTTKKINQMQNTPGAKLWQRNYYEHIVRDEKDLKRIQQYIIENPLKWQDDRYFPDDQ